MVRCRWSGKALGLARGSHGRRYALRVDGCRESEITLRVMDRRHGPMVRQWLDVDSRTTSREGCNGRRAAGLPCQDVRYYRTHLADSAKRPLVLGPHRLQCDLPFP